MCSKGSPRGESSRPGDKGWLLFLLLEESLRVLRTEQEISRFTAGSLKSMASWGRWEGRERVPEQGGFGRHTPMHGGGPSATGPTQVQLSPAAQTLISAACPFQASSCLLPLHPLLLYDQAS